MRYLLLIKSQRDEARERAAADPDGAIVESARAALVDQMEAADSEVDRKRAKRRLLLFVRTQGKAARPEKEPAEPERP